jgi:hypothetical protein
MLSVHSEIKAIARDKAAVFIATALLRSFLERGLLLSLRNYLKRPIASPVGALSVTLTQCSYNPANAQYSLTSPSPNNLQIVLGTSFTALFTIHPTADPAAPLSQVSVTVSSVAADIRISASALLMSSSDQKLTTILTPDPNRDATIKKLNLDPTEVTRVEGLLLYGVIPKVVSSSFSNGEPVNFKEVFPTLRFSGPVDTHIIIDGIAIVPGAGVGLDDTPVCKCSVHLPDFGTTINKSPANGAAEVDFKIPPLPKPGDLGRRTDKKTGFAAVYLPQKYYTQMVASPRPAITQPFGNNGFIGWDGGYTIGFGLPAVTIDPPSLSILVKLELLISVDVQVTMDIPCVGRRPIGVAVARNTSGTSTVSIRYYFVTDAAGKLQIKPHVEDISIYPFTVFVVTFSAWLSYFGPVAAFVGFVIDVILAAVIAHNIPIELRHAIEEQAGSGAWPLVDLSPHIPQLPTPKNMWPTVTSFSGDPQDSIFVGVLVDG